MEEMSNTLVLIPVVSERELANEACHDKGLPESHPMMEYGEK